ncbi:QueT transporter family protein [Clostridium sp. BJN0001]|uniref:QueT transporter family protein n=1 Tax=Clostridium sp. BJN0001 TaxID=2930219 RepID=UPI001FD1A3D3|nr:QueT transporter family protein [Clostridium sp. BJN0001]
MEKNQTVERIVKTAVIAAIYAAITLALAPFSYGNIQFRISEIMVLLALFDPMYIGGLTLGCLIANMLGPNGVMDIVFGTIATFISVSFIYLTGRYVKIKKVSLVIASLWPTIFNGLIIGWMLNKVYSLPLFLTMGQVAAGEFVVVTIIGVPITLLLKEKLKSILTSC